MRKHSVCGVLFVKTLRFMVACAEVEIGLLGIHFRKAIIENWNLLDLNRGINLSD